jgi:hypothetical protein
MYFVLMIFARDHGEAFETWEYRLLPWHPRPLIFHTSKACLTEGIVEGVGGGSDPKVHLEPLQGEE